MPQSRSLRKSPPKRVSMGELQYLALTLNEVLTTYCRNQDVLHIYQEEIKSHCPTLSPLMGNAQDQGWQQPLTFTWRVPLPAGFFEDEACGAPAAG